MFNHQLPNFLRKLSVTTPNYHTKKYHQSNEDILGQTVPKISYAIITFSYDPDGQFIFPLTVWITGMRIQNLLGMDFRQKQVSGILFDLPGIELKNPVKSICYGNFHQNKLYPHLSQMLTIRTP